MISGNYCTVCMVTHLCVWNNEWQLNAQIIDLPRVICLAASAHQTEPWPAISLQLPNTIVNNTIYA